MLEDIAILTAGKEISEDLGIKLENVTLDMLGTAKKVHIDKDNTTIIDGRARRRTFESRVTQLKAQVEETAPTMTARSCRSAWPSSPAAWRSFKVGGATEIEVKERKDRVEDAMHATKAAVEEGVVAGGGQRCSMLPAVLETSAVGNHDQQVGIEIVAPRPAGAARQIGRDSRFDGAVVAGEDARSRVRMVVVAAALVLEHAGSIEQRCPAAATTPSSDRGLGRMHGVLDPVLAFLDSISVAPRP